MKCVAKWVILSGPIPLFFPQHNYPYPFGWYMFGIGTLADEKSIIS